MSSTSREPAGAERDGTSQAGRALAALDPGYVSVDERTSAELLSFARAYGKELKYYGAGGEPEGDWRDFVGAELRPEDVAAFLRDPGKFTPEAAPELYRPHFVLFLAFLQLLEKSRAELNALTGRHLDFYYRQVLRMARRPPVPDRVSLIVELASRGRQVLLPAGTRLDAGPDSLGRARIYATDRDLVVNRTQVEKVSSLFIDRRRTGLRQITSRYANDKQRACEAMFALAIGDPLPPYPGSAQPVDFAVLRDLRDLVRRSESDFFMSPPTLRDLMSRRKLRAETPSEWGEIYAALELAGAKMRGAPFTLGRSSRDLEANLQEAVGPFTYGTLAQVSTVDDLYEYRARGDVRAFVEGTLYFALADFERMMQLKSRFDAAWGDINRTLESAGQKKRNDPSYRLLPGDVTAFADNAKAAVGTDGIEAYWGQLLALEGYFYMPAERFGIAMGEVLDTPQNDWNQIFSVLEEAHREKLRGDRRDELRRLHEATPPARLVDLIRYVLGEAPSPDEDPAAMDRLEPYLGKPDLAKLQASAAASDWEAIYVLLEIAERNRLGEPPAEKEEWFNLFPAEDATAVSLRPAVTAGGAPAWATFGAARPSSSAGPAPRPVLGWALCSPLLVLGEGQRVITLTLGFSSARSLLEDLFRKGGELPLIFQLSTAKGWIECSSVGVQIGSYKDLIGKTSEDEALGARFTLTLPPGVDPIAAPPAGLAGMNSPWPVLRLMLRPIWSGADKKYVVRYRELGDLLMVSAHVRVEARGLRAIKLQNDEATLDATKPFEPFGSAPAVGSRFLIGHHEVAGKKLDSLAMSFQWIGAPADLAAHYTNYPSAPFAFTARVSLVDRRGETELAKAAPLFGAKSSDPTSITVTTALAAAAAADPQALVEGSTDEDLSASGRYLQWELNAPDFQHGSYPVVASSKALALSVAVAGNPSTVNAAQYQVSPPYTPKLKSLTIDYASSLELRFDGAPRAAGVDRVFHVHPFGACDGESARSSAGLPFLPRYENDGELYLGLRDLAPPQTVSILFQMAEGSANLDVPPSPVRWSCLSGDRWIPLEHHRISDTTRGLINSGIVELALDPVEPSTRLRGDLYWIRAAVERDTRGLCDTIAVHTQAVTATFVDNDNAPDHFGAPLPAGTITKLSAAIPEIAGVRQPYASYGGRTAEGADTWATRVSERLRHKQRALTVWDYERLVLDRFPTIYRVKCVPATLGEPGTVKVVVIPDVRNKLPADPYKPKAPTNLLADVREHLAARAPAAASIAVVNAHYVDVRVRLGVRFRGDGDDAYYTQRLNDDLNRFLAPWAYAEGADLAIGGRIYANSIVDFVERRPYVDFVAGIKLFRSDDGERFQLVPPPADGSGAFVGTTRPDEVLTSAREHLIDILREGLFQETLMTGVNFMKLELDFFIH
ncbi:MAG TPA: baseplate J/gp47 family protein [Sorangium sp.]|nr:baseplate J/gp47 family protein [Sorangium sp.]